MPTLSDISLKISYWFVSHRQQFRRWWFIMIVALNFLLIVYVAIMMTFYISESDNIAKAVSTMPRFIFTQGYKNNHQPAELEISDPAALARGDGRFDLASRVDNTNDQWAATVSFSYYSNDNLVNSSRTYISPNTVSYLVGLNVSIAETEAKNVVIEIDSIDWIFVPSRENYTKPSFLVSSTSRSTALSGQGGSTVVNSTIKNTAVIGWKQVSVDVVITLGDQILGVNQYVVRDWLSLTERDIQVQWQRTFETSAQINILPVVNPFDQNQVIR